MELKFISQIRKGNNRGTGFVYLPKDKANFFKIGDWVRVEILENKFFAKIIFYSSRLGIYVPKHIVIKNNLINNKAEIQLEKVDGFYAKIYSDGRIFIPKSIIKRQKLNHNAIVLIKGIENSKVIYERFSKVCGTKRKNRSTEYHCVFDKTFLNKELLFKIENRSQETSKEKLGPILDELLKAMHYALIDKDSIIVFKGNKIPVILSSKIDYREMAFCLGAYFADGTKKGNSWAICASTFEQARYYFKMHNFLIKDSRPKFTISYTNIHETDNSELKRKLAKIWENEVGVKVNKFRIRKPTGKVTSKWNKYGTLVIKEHRQILLDIYNFLLKELIKEILSLKNRGLAVDFLCGVMEGDGCAPARKRGHVTIFTNKNDVHTLENICKVAKIKFKTYRDDKNKYSLRIGALELLKNFHLLKDKIFVLYPKRRKLFFERLKTVGAAKFFIGSYNSTGQAKAWLKNNGFCDENYKITDKGLRLGNELIVNINKAITYG